MQLDPDLFRRLVGEAPLPLPDDGPSERRSGGRVFLGRRAHITLTVDPAVPPIGVVVRDASLRGVGILTTRPLATGDRFLLTLPLAPSVRPDDASAINDTAPHSITLECQTLWSKPGEFGDGASLIVGAEFIGVAAGSTSGASPRIP